MDFLDSWNCKREFWLPVSWRCHESRAKMWGVEFDWCLYV